MDNSERSQTEDEIDRLRKALDAEVQRGIELRKQLDRADADFEEFVSLAAHNLREPLRDVASFSQLMTETYAGRLDSDADMYLRQIREGAERIDALLADVVDYWAAGTSNRGFSRTDMEAVLRQALLSTEATITAQGAMVTHDPLPSVMGDFDVLTKVLQHVIRNAVEYSPGSPRIHISARRAEHEWVFGFADNGPGIEAACQDRIFGVFRRLHGKEHPGSGLGLAFCKKAAERHGGRIWLDSAPGSGSTFYVALPAAD